MRLHTTLRARVQPLTNRPDRQPGDHRTLTTQQHRLPTQPPLFTDASIIHTSPFSFFFLLVIYYNNTLTSPGSISTVTSGGRDGVTAGRKRCVPVLGGPAAVPARLLNRCSGCTRGSGGGADPFLRAIFSDARIRRCFEVRAGPRASPRSGWVPSEAGGSPAFRLRRVALHVPRKMGWQGLLTSQFEHAEIRIRRSCQPCCTIPGSHWAGDGPFEPCARV